MTPLLVELAFELPDRAQHMHQQSAHRRVLVRVDSLAGDALADTEPVQLLEGVEAIDEGAAPAIQFPADHGIEVPQTGVRHEAVQVRPGGFGAGNGVDILFVDVPSAPGCDASQFARSEEHTSEL